MLSNFISVVATSDALEKGTAMGLVTIDWTLFSRSLIPLFYLQPYRIFICAC